MINDILLVSLTRYSSELLIDMSVDLFNIDAIQGLDLLCSGGRFGLVVSISLKDK